MTRKHTGIHPQPLFLIGGSSSVGKTTAAIRVSQLFRVPCHHLDDHLNKIQDDNLHFETENLNIATSTSQELCERLIQLAKIATPYISSLIEKYEEEGNGQVIEGERIHPVLMEDAIKSTTKTGVFIIEDDPRQLYRNLQGRSRRFQDLLEEQKWKVVEMDWLYGQWLRQEAERRDIPWVASLPWDSLCDRIVERLII